MACYLREEGAGHVQGFGSADVVIGEGTDILSRTFYHGRGIYGDLLKLVIYVSGLEGQCLSGTEDVLDF